MPWLPEDSVHPLRVDLPTAVAAHDSFLHGLLDDAETELLGCVHVDPPEKAGGARRRGVLVGGRPAGGQ